MRRSKLPIPRIVSGIAISGQVRPGITFRRRAGLGPEAYGLEVGPHGIVISATGGTGLFYGAVTLWQLMTPDKRPATLSARAATIPAPVIRDAPAYPWRGLILQSAPHHTI